MCRRKITFAQNDMNMKHKYPAESNNLLHKTITDLVYLSTFHLQINRFEMRLKADIYMIK